MSFTIQFEKDKTLITYGQFVDFNDIKNAFLNITEILEFEELEFIIHDFSQTISFVKPLSYLSKERILTKFATYWNPDITVIVIANQQEVTSYYTDIVKYERKLTWKHLLFKAWDEVLTWNENLGVLHQHKFRNQVLS